MCKRIVSCFFGFIKAAFLGAGDFLRPAVWPAPGYEGRTGEGYEEGGGMRTKLCIFGVDVAKKKEYNRATNQNLEE